MKWNIDRVSPLIDGAIVISILIAIMWVLPDNWFSEAKPIKYQNFIIAMMIFYHVGQWSGRRSQQREVGDE